MTDALSFFKDNVMGSQGKIQDVMPTISSSGDFKKITELDVIINSWRNILLTPIGSYDHDPSYGSTLYQLIWEPADEETMDLVKSEVIDRLMTYDNRAVIKNVDVIFFSNRKGFNVNVSVEYKNEKKDLSINLTDMDTV